MGDRSFGGRERVLMGLGLEKERALMGSGTAKVLRGPRGLSGLKA